MSNYISMCLFVGRGRREREGNCSWYLLSLLESSCGHSVALLVLQQLLRRLHELVADVALKHARDQVDLKVPLIHSPCLTHKVTEHTFKACQQERERER